MFETLTRRGIGVRFMKRLIGAAYRQRNRPQTARFPNLESLEVRLVPALDLTIGSGVTPTTGVTASQVGGTTTFAANANGAFLNVADLAPALGEGDVVIQSGQSPDSPGDLTVVENTLVQGNQFKLTLQSTGGLVVSPGAEVSTDSGALTLALAGSFRLDGALTSESGPINMHLASIFVNTGATLRSMSASVVITADFSFQFQGLVQSGSGPVQISGGIPVSENIIDLVRGASLPSGLNYAANAGCKLAFSDQHDTSGPHSYVVTPTSLIHDGTAPITFTGASALLVFGGDRNCTYDVAGGAGAVLVLFAGSGVDTLSLIQGAPVGTTAMEFRFGLSGKVNASGMERINLLNPTAVDAFYGPEFAQRSSAFEDLSADERFVQALYLDALGRPGGKSELDGWLTAFPLAGGPSQSGQESIARGVEHSPEARTRLARSWYVSMLDRRAGSGEELYWVNMLLQGATEETVLSRFLSAGEFFARAQANPSPFTQSPEGRFVVSLYRHLLYRTAITGEIEHWVGQIAQAGQESVARAFLGSGEFRTNQLAGYYAALLHRLADRDGLNVWVTSTADMNLARLGFESSAEFYANG